MRERLPDHHETGTFADRTHAAVSELLEALQSLQAFVAVTIGRGPNAKIPETIPTPLGIQVNIGAIMRDADAAVAKAEGTLLRPRVAELEPKPAFTTGHCAGRAALRAMLAKVNKP